MVNPVQISALFLDVGGVLLTNGWDHVSRKEAAVKFNLNFDEMEKRHQLTFDTFEIGKLSLEGYLKRVVFYEKRAFSVDEFKAFMFAQSKPFPEMIDLMRKLKERYPLKIGVVSNEGRELTEYRTKKFELGKFVDFFISSCFVHLRKPDAEIYKMAIDIAQLPAQQILYIEDRPLFIEVGEGVGLRGLHHTSFASTVEKLSELGLKT